MRRSEEFPRTLVATSSGCATCAAKPSALKNLISQNGRLINREFVSVQEAKELTGISDWTWRKWAERGVLASVKIRSRLLIPLSEIQRLLDEGLRPAVARSESRAGR
jgi:excisionase family DNA binding protein